MTQPSLSPLPADASAPRSNVAAWPALVAFGAAFLLVQCAQIVLVFAVGAWRAHRDSSRVGEEALRFALSANGIMAAAAVSASTFAAVALAASRRPPGGRVAALRLGPSRATGSGVAAAVLGMGGLSVALGTASDLLHLRAEGTMEQIANALSNLPPARLPLALAAIAVAPGVAEEIFFRGLLQRRLVARCGRWRGIALSAAGFGLVHLDPLQGSVAAASGFFLGWVGERLDGVRPTIAAHVTNNALFVALAPWTFGPHLSRAASVAWLGAGCVAFASSVAFLRSRHAVRASRCAS